jgi:cell division protein FtsI/penicillin-binding protein 2
VDRAFGTQQGAAVVIRVRDRHVLAAHNRVLLARRVATPGSTIKPFVLGLLLEKGVVGATEPILCRRNLVIGGKRLSCSHPPDLASFTAEDALAFSCNSYFTAAVARLRSGELEQRFAELGFNRISGLLPGEGEGSITPARTMAGRQLLGIGAAGIKVTPLELASAYLKLARDARTAPSVQNIVLAGLRNAVAYGLAQNARVDRLDVAGKTGTASDRGGAFTHAWFAGFAPAAHPEVVVVVFIESGRGSIEPASIAAKIFAAYAERRR